MFIILIILVIIGLWLGFTYNSLVKRSQRVKEAWADIDVQLKRRYDLVPNLVSTVKGYMTHEKEVFEKVTEARTRAMAASGKGEKLEAENQFSQTLKSLFAVAENYPELKANQNFLGLQQELVDTEDKIQAARRFYNGVVRDYNIAIKVLPVSLIAGWFGFKEEPLFDVKESQEREAVKVEF
ncbi:MAG: LemA family protein [Candidatus Paceibacterota bacterium]|jgi:LemA protein|nr:LemA family protein [Candidatus Paceibacterota bacterium]MDD3548584.1 LemA family protein [Candidatus Paceibacterota bacterium]MDD4999033.1 LemA family protein [Candidatus Paceibacterota bacterium]MDD5545190.1 LemA family protein [Candidatus Paceibacterota bacterium]